MEKDFAGRIHRKSSKNRKTSKENFYVSGLLKITCLDKKKAGGAEQGNQEIYSSSFNTKCREHLKKLLCNCLKKVNGNNSTEYKSIFLKIYKMLFSFQ